MAQKKGVLELKKLTGRPSSLLIWLTKFFELEKYWLCPNMRVARNRPPRVHQTTLASKVQKGRVIFCVIHYEKIKILNFFQNLTSSRGGNGALWKYKGFCQKYKGKFGFSYFWIFRPISLLKNHFKLHRLISLINSVHLIPILPYFMWIYAVWHLS